MLTRLAVTNFRAIGERTELELRPLTILVGPNGSGKTSFLQALALTAQSMVEDPSRHDWVLTGSRIDLSSLPSLAHLHDQTLGTSVECAVDATRLLSKNPPLGAHWGTWKPWPPSQVAYRWTRFAEPRTLWRHDLLFDGEIAWRLSQAIDNPSSRNSGITQTATWLAQHSAIVDVAERWNFVPERVLNAEMLERLSSVIQSDNAGDQNRRTARLGAHEFVRRTVCHLTDQFTRTSYLAALRGAALIHLDVGPEVHEVGEHGEQTVRLLASMRGRDNPAFEALERWAAEFGLQGLIAAWGGGQQLKVHYRDSKSGPPLDFREAAGGSQQMLIILAHLFLNAPGSILLIEEPENNLHPAWARLLPRVFADSIKLGNQLVVSTHSETLIASLGPVIAEGSISTADVAVWHCARQGSHVELSRVHFNDMGTTVEGWPESFAKVHEDIADDWSKALPEAGKPSRSGRGANTSRGKKLRTR